MRRRQALSLLGTAGILAVAGCPSQVDQPSSPTDTTTAGGGSGTTRPGENQLGIEVTNEDQSAYQIDIRFEAEEMEEWEYAVGELSSFELRRTVSLDEITPEVMLTNSDVIYDSGSISISFHDSRDEVWMSVHIEDGNLGLASNCCGGIIE